MSDRSQLPLAYGEHWSPPTDWDLYDQCNCGAAPGKPCRDKRAKRSKVPDLWNPHSDRLLLTPS